MFNNILVLVDGSDFSLNAAKVGASMADKYDSKLQRLCRLWSGQKKPLNILKIHS
jgi:hypothetical protein